MDRIQLLVPLFGSSEDGIWFGGPDERLRPVVVVGEIAVDGALQIYKRMVVPNGEALIRQLVVPRA